MKAMSVPQAWRVFSFILVLTVSAAVIALPVSWPVQFQLFGRSIQTEIKGPQLRFGRWLQLPLPLKQGLDIQGGMQVLLEVDLSEIEANRQAQALDSATEIIRRRVDLYGISEPVVQTAQQGDSSRIIVELPGVDDPTQALALIGQTAELDFRLFNPDAATASAEIVSDGETATDSATPPAQTIDDFLQSFEETGLTGQNLREAGLQFSQGSEGTVQGEPVVALEFDQTGTELFREITTENQGETLAIFLDGAPIMTPQINTPILDGKAVITGQFTVEQAQNLAIQLNAGALPVPIEVIEQRTIGASLGQASVRASIQAGLVGLGLVMLFMTLYYGFKGVIASLALVVYSVLTIAVYKIMGVTLTLPGIAGLLLSIGMAVDANILIFERMKEELRDGKPFEKALELGFGRAWDSIKDANLATIVTSLVLINPFNLSILNRSGLVRGFGITLFLGVLISLFTGVVVTRTLMILFLAPPTSKDTDDKQS